MARLLVRTVSPLIRSTIEIMLGGRHKLLTAGGRDAELAIVDIEAEDPSTPSDTDDVVRTISECAAPRVLVLLDRSAPIPFGVREGTGLAVLRKPFERFELSLQIDRLLAQPVVELPAADDAADETAELSKEPPIDWLEFPCVAAPAGAVLRRAASLDAPLWLLGEPGSGRRRIAEAVCRVSRPPRRMATWFADQDLETALAEPHAAGGETPLALYVPAIDERSVAEQERLCAAMAAGARFRLIATSVDDPAEKAATGGFHRQLYHMLSGATVQISPLRERPIAIAPLVELLTARAAKRLGCKSVTYSADAMARLQSYMWPGNLVELESVVTRTLLLAGRLGTDARVIGAGEIRFTPETLSSEAAPAKRPESSGGRRLSAVATLTGAGEARTSAAAASAREARPASSPSPETVTTLPSVGQPAVKAAASPAEVRGSIAPASVSGEGIENVLSALAHDLRNPMVSIKTFAGVISSGKADSDSTRELGQLASSACDRIDGYIDTLLRYGAFGAPKPERLDLTEMLWHALSARRDDFAERVHVDADLPSNISADREQVDFLLNVLLDAALVEAGTKGTVRIKRTAPGSLEWTIEAPQGAVTQLRRISGKTDDVASWRVALARALTERNGGRLQMDADGGAVALHWSLPLAG